MAVVLLSLWVPRRKASVIAAAACTILTLFGLAFSPTGGELWKVLTNRALAVFVIWTTALLSLRRKGEEDQLRAAVKAKEALSKEIHHVG